MHAKIWNAESEVLGSCFVRENVLESRELDWCDCECTSSDKSLWDLFFLCLYEFPFSQPCIRGLEKLTQSAGKDHSLGAVGIPDKVQWHSHWCHCAHLLPGKHTARSLHWFLATGTCNRSVMDSASLITKNWVYLVQVLCQIFTKDRKRYVVLSVSIQAPEFIAVAKEKKTSKFIVITSFKADDVTFFLRSLLRSCNSCSCKT